MNTETIIAIVYFGGTALCAGFIVWSGLTDRWSKDDWPMFALLISWFWPLLLPLGVFGWFEDRNNCKCYYTGDNPKCPWHGEGKFILASKSTKQRKMAMETRHD